MTRPRVTCHMMMSVDGRIITDGWPLSATAQRQYEEVHEALGADAWLCGRVTMQQHFASGARSAVEVEVEEEYAGPSRADYVADSTHTRLAIAVDARGKLLWKSGTLHGEQVVTILSERVSDAYLASLRQAGVTYLFAGRRTLDLSLALKKIRAQLGVRTLTLEGGGEMNRSMLRAGLVDELSVLVAPVVDPNPVGSALFGHVGDSDTPVRLSLISAEPRPGQVIWLRYRVESSAAGADR